MLEIDVKVDTLLQAIESLNTLKEFCDNSIINPPTTVGGGKMVNELEELGQLYKMVNTHLSDMVYSTILFLQKTKESFEENDRKAAINIK